MARSWWPAAVPVQALAGLPLPSLPVGTRIPYPWLFATQQEQTVSHFQLPSISQLGVRLILAAFVARCVTMLTSNFIESFVPESISDFRRRAWARFVIRLCFASAPCWVIFTAISVAIALPAWAIAVFPALAACQLAIPFLLRSSGRLYLAMMALGTVCFAGITFIAFLQGGFPFRALLWLMVLPVAAAGQRDSRSLLPVWGAACLAEYVVWYVLATTGHAPTGWFDVSPATGLWLDGISLTCWLAVLVLVSKTTSWVTYEFADARDAYQHAVMQAQKLDALGKVAGSIENNFNNALMSIDYAAHLLTRSIDGDELREELDEVKETVRRSKALSRKLERLGRGHAQDVELVHVDTAIAALATMLRRLTGDSIAVHLRPNGETAQVRCDANQLDQVLVNLVVNARDAMPGGGEIVIATHATSTSIVIAVSDTGTGIAPDVLAHVFEPFFTTKDQDSGTGLGLWICRSIVEGAGGSLVATSRVREGTTMRIELPLADPGAVYEAPVQPSSAQRAEQSGSWPTAGRRTPSLASRSLDWFVRGVGDQRLRARGRGVVAIGFSTVPFWLAFAAVKWASSGLNAAVFCLLAGAVLCALTPFLVRVTHSPKQGGFAIASVGFGVLTALAITRGGFPLEILAWTAVIPVAAAHQREFRHFTFFWAAAVVGQYLLIFALANGATDPTAMPVDDLIALLVLMTWISHRASKVAQRFADEREGYATTLVKSQDYELLGTFASSIAHDLNNVLTTLEVVNHLIGCKLPADHPGRVHLDELGTAAGKITALARQLTRFGRANDGTADVIPATALATLAPMLGPIVGSQVTIDLDLRSGAAAIPIRSNELDQMMINLALNARDAMPDGGRLSIVTSATADRVTICVSDAGIGIPPHLLGSVCDPFFTTEPDRVGLGLWVCREIVTGAQGELNVDSTVGGGTTIRIVMPRAQPGPLTRGASSRVRRHPSLTGWISATPTSGVRALGTGSMTASTAHQATETNEEPS